LTAVTSDSTPPELAEDFARLATAADGEFEMALTVARFIDAQTQTAAVHAALDTLLEQLSEPACNDVAAMLEGLVRCGYGRQVLRQVDAMHSHIGWVLQQKQGLPISLAVLLVVCARRLGFDSCGINFPGHFLVRVDDIYVDPLRMEAVPMEQLNSRGLNDMDFQTLLQPATVQALGLRMLNNLKTLYGNAQDWHRVLDLLDCQLALVRDDAGMAGLLHFERGEMWEQAGAARIARDAYQICLESDVSSDLRDKALARIAALDGRDETLH
jgi:regulator of sirC expression with transglutaminase-like and TPR domain